MEDNKTRKTYTAEAKYKIVKEALTTDQGTTGVCRKYGIAPSLFYKWQEAFFKGARLALEPGAATAKGLTSQEQRELTELKNDNSKMKDVIAEITAENISFKKKSLV